ncbi:MAG: bifunctional UDP-N-acetylglucosamine diphosphorylase/glucosamine-1-phosphate N-acetyltransferase GlmU [Antricoccus sp.]
MSVAPIAVIVLAAGAGTRMKSTTPKVLHQIGGRTLLGHVLAAAAPLAATHTVVVVGAGRERVQAHISSIDRSIRTVVQERQDGSGHATKVALDSLADLDGTVVVLNADVPLLTAQTIAAFCDAHAEAGNAMTVLSAEVPNPRGLGRIIREGARVTAIIEDRDADELQLAINEINAGVYAFDAHALTDALSKVTTGNSQGEQYLTDVLQILVADGHPVGAHVIADYEQTLGCNDRLELAERGRMLNDRILEHWMRAGVTVLDPQTVWIDVDVELQPDVTLLPNVQLHGATRIDSGATVGPDSTLIDTEVGPAATVIRTHAHLAVVGPGATVGPFAYLRPKAILRENAKVGTFVEVKNGDIGAGAKVPHLSYVGDATIGEGTNIGAASVFVNYDGVNKHHTTVGKHCRMGSDNMYVAPITVGDGAVSGAGAVLRADVPSGALAVSGGPQRNIEGWVVNNRAGTPAANAALAAQSQPRLGEQ